MASKASKRAAMSAKANNAPVDKDDGTRWVLYNMDTKRPVYGTNGVTKADAVRLGEGLVAPTYIEQVE